jgi:hypothetical protein
MNISSNVSQMNRMFLKQVKHKLALKQAATFTQQ